MSFQESFMNVLKTRFAETAGNREFAKTVEPLSSLFAEVGIAFELRYLTFAEMRDSLKLEAAHREALERYIV